MSTVVPQLRRTILNSRVGGPLRRVRRAFRPAHFAQNRLDNEHLRAILGAILDPGSNCIDIGAHQGEFLADIVRLAPAGKHFAFEPIPQLAAQLAQRYPDVDVREVALSDQGGEASFVHVITRPGFSGFREHAYPGRERLERLTVKTERLDDVLPAEYAPAFIKIDVEGAEYAVLRGALATIRRHRPVIAFEHGLGSADFYDASPAALFALLTEDAGMRIFDLWGLGPYDRAGFISAFEQHQQVNFLARP